MIKEHHPSIQELLENFPFFVALYGPEYKLKWANKIAREHSMQFVNDLKHVNCYELWGFSSPCKDCPAKKVLGQRLTSDLELSGPCRPGEPGNDWVWQLHLVPVIGPNNRPEAILETACDISQMKQTERDLKINRARLSDAQRLAHIGHWELLPETGDLFWSEEIFRIFEIDPASFDASYEAFLNTAHPDDRENVHQAYTRSLETRRPYSIEHRLLMDDGRIKYVQERCKTDYNSEGTPVKSIGTVQDITENKKIEAENKELQKKILHAQKMESVGRLAGGVAHDFNNMLCVILGQLDLLMDDMEAGDPLLSALEEIQNAAQRSSDLTRQLLAFARQQPITPKILDLNQVIENMLKILTRLIGEDIDLVWLPGENPGKIKLDPSQVDQILANLCINARDAISGNGKITIETHRVSLDEESCSHRPGFFPGEFVVLAISDNGCGMDKKTISRLFEPFFTTKKADRGTGLGLATIYGIVKQNKGFINVYSEPGSGTTFRIYFSVYMGDEKATLPKVPQQSISGGTETILLVEDETMILRFCSKMLHNLGYRVFTANSPSQALDLAKIHGHSIDLLITDVIMAQMSGRDLAEILTHDFPDLKTLYISGYTANVIAHHGILNEGIMFLQKPFSTSQLAQKVRQALAAPN